MKSDYEKLHNKEFLEQRMAEQERKEREEYRNLRQYLVDKGELDIE